MLKVYPDYYKDFCCIADKCRHNCCIGWEIDIDDHTAQYYKEAENVLSVQLKNRIDASTKPAHFILDENERCPFLSNNNLCNIITCLGEEHLCTICTEHPRFHNELPGRIESGVGMCCEEAARIILSKKEPTNLVCEGSPEGVDEIIEFRDKITEILQNREAIFSHRVDNMLNLCVNPALYKDIGQWADVFLSLERLDENWTKVLETLKQHSHQIPCAEFDTYMHQREAEYEQLCVYLIYRHLANAPDIYEAELIAKFTALSYFLLRNIGAVMYLKKGDFSFENQVDLCRMFSAEIEYSDENLYIVLNEIERFN